MGNSYHLLTPEQRGDILGLLKKGPKLEDRQALAEYTAHVYKVVTGKDLKQNCDAMMKAWRIKNSGRCNSNETFVW